MRQLLQPLHILFLHFPPLLIPHRCQPMLPLARRPCTGVRSKKGKESGRADLQPIRNIQIHPINLLYPVVDDAHRLRRLEGLLLAREEPLSSALCALA